MRVSTYSLRRFFPTVADRLRIPVDRRHDLGDWCDTPLDGAVPVRHAPMAVRYSDARLESSADSRRVCHLALYKARLANFENDEDVRLMSPQVLTLYEQVLNPTWGFLARGLDVPTQPTAPIPPGKAAAVDSDPGAESSSSYSSSSSSSAASAPSTPRPVASSSNAEAAPKAILRWILPTVGCSGLS